LGLPLAFEICSDPVANCLWSDPDAALPVRPSDQSGWIRPDVVAVDPVGVSRKDANAEPVPTAGGKSVDRQTANGRIRGLDIQAEGRRGVLAVDLDQRRSGIGRTALAPTIDCDRLPDDR